MPRQQTNSRGPKDRNAAPKPAQKRKNGRAMNALSIAEKQIPNKLGVRRTRLGYYDDGSNPKRYSNRDDDEDGDEEEGDVPNYKRRRFNTAPDNESLNGGSDSEGHEWKLGQVDSDDDEELDSDEALGDSDEERFEGFTFRGSSTTKSKSKAKKPTKKRADVNLSENGEESEEGESDESDDLGEDAVDLLTAWDMNTAEEEAEAKKAATKSKKPSIGEDSDEDSGSEGDSEEDEDESDDDQLSFSEEDADDQGDGLSKLQDFVDSMDTGRRTKSTQKSQEQGKPSEYGLTSSRKLTVADLLPSITDSRLKGSLKHVDAAPKESKAGIPGKLDAPLAKRQQDKLDRSAAYDKSKETLDRWIETVKHNRRAEHLVFPLPDPDNEQVHRMHSAKPANDLEATIQNILTESGLAQTNGQSNEDEVQGFEDIQARTLPIEEIQARRAELRKRRDLLFREEVRSKRIKKIKSKAYRRVHRKERERLEQQEKQALLEAGVDLDEMDQEKNERLRAEARMGSKHRDSKWAKSLKETGRTAWDEEARNGAADLALREEELRRRIEGKSVSRGDDAYLESSSESEDDDPWASDASDVEKRKVQKKLRALDKEADTELPKGRHSDLFAMKFMQNADAARKEENDAEVRRLNRELHGEGSESEAESEVGRRKFGQSKKTDSKPQTKALPKNELEEAAGSDDEDQDVDIVVDRPVKQKPATSALSKPTTKPSDKMFSQQPKETAVEENPWLVSTERTNRRRTGTDAQEAMEITLDDEQPEPVQTEVSSKKTKPSKQSQQTPAKKASHSDAQYDSDDEDNVPVLLKNHDLVKRAFAGDEVVQDFEQEKLDTIEDEGDKVVDNTLDGWGSWAGEGVSKKAQKNKKRFLTKVEGVKPEQRKDAKLDRVIINQKRVKKNAKYMASTLPHEFESKAQYERSLRMPLGPEWSTKETFQSGTKPRVIVKKGIIKPMDKPMI